MLIYSIAGDLRAMGLLQCFNVILNVPKIGTADEVKTVLHESDYKISDAVSLINNMFQN